FPGDESDEGGFATAGAQDVSFDHIELITVTNGPGGPGCPIVIFGTNADDDITVIARDAGYSPGTPGLDGIQDFTVSVNNGPELLFINAPTLAIDGLAGDDDIVIRTPAPNNPPSNANLTAIPRPPPPPPPP